MSETEQTKRGRRKVRSGIVVSDCQDKTAIVLVERRTAHPLYKKVLTRKKKYYVHDEVNEAQVGDRVEIVETRPLSKLKRWRLQAVLQRAVTE